MPPFLLDSLQLKSPPSNDFDSGVKLLSPSSFRPQGLSFPNPLFLEGFNFVFLVSMYPLEVSPLVSLV